MEDLVLSCLESRVENNRNLYARFLVGPFFKGNALTIATALRRVLLSSVESVAITALYIQGITHEFSSIVGVRESVLELSLNFQSIVLSYDKNFSQRKSFFEDFQIGYLQVEGPKVVYANDLKLPLGIKVVDPTQYIATVSREGVIILKFTIGKIDNSVISNSSSHSSFINEPDSTKQVIHHPVFGELVKKNIIKTKQKYSYKNVYAINAPFSFTSSSDLSFTTSQSLSPEVIPVPEGDRLSRPVPEGDRYVKVKVKDQSPSDQSPPVTGTTGTGQVRVASTSQSPQVKDEQNRRFVRTGQVSRFAQEVTGDTGGETGRETVKGDDKWSPPFVANRFSRVQDCALLNPSFVKAKFIKKSCNKADLCLDAPLLGYKTSKQNQSSYKSIAFQIKDLNHLLTKQVPVSPPVANLLANRRFALARRFATGGDWSCKKGRTTRNLFINGLQIYDNSSASANLLARRFETHRLSCVAYKYLTASLFGKRPVRGSSFYQSFIESGFTVKSTVDALKYLKNKSFERHFCSNKGSDFNHANRKSVFLRPVASKPSSLQIFLQIKDSYLYAIKTSKTMYHKSLCKRRSTATASISIMHHKPFLRRCWNFSKICKTKLTPPDKSLSFTTSQSRRTKSKICTSPRSGQVKVKDQIANLRFAQPSDQLPPVTGTTGTGQVITTNKIEDLYQSYLSPSGTSKKGTGESERFARRFVRDWYVKVTGITTNKIEDLYQSYLSPSGTSKKGTGESDKVKGGCADRRFATKICTSFIPTSNLMLLFLQKREEKICKVRSTKALPTSFLKSDVFKTSFLRSIRTPCESRSCKQEGRKSKIEEKQKQLFFSKRSTNFVKKSVRRNEVLKPKVFRKEKIFKSDICLRNIIPLDFTLSPVLKVNFVIEIDDEVLYLRQKVRERIILEVWTNGSIHPRQALHDATLSLLDMFSSFRSLYQNNNSYTLPLLHFPKYS